jgi:RNA-binding protein 23/39
VGGLVDILSSVTESEIRQWFNPFGEIESIELPKDHITGRNKGHAVIEFKKHRDAKNAIKEMNGFDINGRKLKVSILTDAVSKQLNNADYDLEDDTAN